MARCCTRRGRRAAPSLTEGLHCALVELLTKRILDGSHLAERLQRGGKSRRPASGSEATDSRIASVLTR
jgi:hypothetical protein